jgi:hypothetical protein
LPDARRGELKDPPHDDGLGLDDPMFDMRVPGSAVRIDASVDDDFS